MHSCAPHHATHRSEKPPCFDACLEAAGPPIRPQEAGARPPRPGQEASSRAKGKDRSSTIPPCSDRPPCPRRRAVGTLGLLLVVGSMPCTARGRQCECWWWRACRSRAIHAHAIAHARLIACQHSSIRSDRSDRSTTQASNRSIDPINLPLHHPIDHVRQGLARPLLMAVPPPEPLLHGRLLPRVRMY